MKFGTVTINNAIDSILAHNLYAEDGARLLNKGRRLSADDLDLLRSKRYREVIVAQPEENDIHENEAARRIGKALAGDGIRVTAPGVGRANLTTTVRGVLRINVPLLAQINNIYDGIAVASLREHTLVKQRELAILVKIVPFFVPNARILDIEHMTQHAEPVISVRPLQPKKVALIISGPESIEDKLVEDFHTPVRERIEFLGSELLEPVYVSHTPDAIAQAMRNHQQCDLIIVASVSAIIDPHDIVPDALHRAGGTLTIHGVPVDPGTLLMMGYLNHIPVIGAPGCIKSPKANVIDWVLPRLLAGERLTRSDFVVMGHGGLLQDIPNRPMPRKLD